MRASDESIRDIFGTRNRAGIESHFQLGWIGMLTYWIKEGNPADSSRLLPMIKRIKECDGKLPRQVAADAGYASKKTIREAKELGIKAVGLPKKRGMTIETMTGSEWRYKKLERFRAGVEGNISMLKRVFGLDRCTGTDSGLTFYIHIHSI